MSPALLVLTNGNAGSSESGRVDEAVTELRSGAEVDVVACGHPDELPDVIARLGDRRLIVAGGDGSVHAAVRAWWHTDREGLADAVIGVLPMGTGNDLARGLGLPTDPAVAARVCLDGTVRRLDLLTIDDGEVVVNASHAGLGAAAAERSEGMKSFLGPLAYPAGAVVAGVREASWDVTVTLDERIVHDGPALLVAVANAPSVGGGTRLVPPAVPDDGQLDVVVVSAVERAAKIAFAAALRNEAHLDRDDVLHLRGRAVTIAGDPIVHDIDGELTDPRQSATYEVVPAAWQLLVT